MTQQIDFKHLFVITILLTLPRLNFRRTYVFIQYGIC